MLQMNYLGLDRCTEEKGHGVTLNLLYAYNAGNLSARKMIWIRKMIVKLQMFCHISRSRLASVAKQSDAPF